MDQQINRRSCLQAFYGLAYSALILFLVEPIPYLSTEDMVNNWPEKSTVYLPMRVRSFYMLDLPLQISDDVDLNSTILHLHLRSVHILKVFLCFAFSITSNVFTELFTTFTGERGPPKVIFD